MLPSLALGWKVSPLRMDMFWKESIRVMEEGEDERAGRRRGLAVDMLMYRRWGLGGATVSYATLAGVADAGMNG